LLLQKDYSINALLLLFFKKKQKFTGREDRFKVIDLAMIIYLLSELTGNSIIEEKWCKFTFNGVKGNGKRR
jgi:hypothetical protein